jgi:hypothetical protein
MSHGRAPAVARILGTDGSRSRINTLSGYEAEKLWVFAVLQLWLARWGVEDVIAHSPWKALGVT